MEFRSERIKEIRIQLEADVDKRDDKIDKHRDIKLVTISKLELINKILAEDETIDQNEFNVISDHYSDFHK